jgi:hypothetical protein
MQNIFQVAISQIESIFQNHNLAVKNYAPIEMATDFFGVKNIFLLVVFLLLALELLVNAKAFLKMCSAMFTNNAFYVFVKNKSWSNTASMFPAIMLFLVFTPLLLIDVMGNQINALNVSFLELYLMIFVTVIVFLLIKILLTYLFFHLVKEGSTFSICKNNIIIFDAVFSVLVTIVYFVALPFENFIFKDAIWQLSLLLVVSIFFIFRFVRTFFLIKTNTNLSYFQIFLYLCTSEIGLFLVIGAFILKNYGN